MNATEVVFAYLEAWPSQVGNLGLAIDQDESKYIFYIGSDKSLYYVSSIEGTNLGSWSVYDSLSTEYWPLADDEAADFAVASDPSTYDIRIYYMSGGSMTEVSRTEKDTWAEAAALPTKASTTVSHSSLFGVQVLRDRGVSDDVFRDPPPFAPATISCDSMKVRPGKGQGRGGNVHSWRDHYTSRAYS